MKVGGMPMKNGILRALSITAAGLILLSCSNDSVAQDGAALYRSKCLSCHGPTGAGRPAIKGTNLLTDEVKTRSDAELAEAIAEGGRGGNDAHAFSKKGVSPDQVLALVAYIRELQKK